MIEDLTGGGEDEDGRQPIGPALALPAPVGPSLLICAETMHRRDDLPACNRVLFTEVDDVTGEERFDPALRGGIAEDQKWQQIMGWPVPPTIEEVSAFQHNARAARLASWWERLKAAKAEDDRAPQVGDWSKPNGRPDRPGGRKAAPATP